MTSNSVAFLGPAGTFAHMAAKSRFGADADLIPCANIRDVFKYVESHADGLGLVPIENSSGGTIYDTVDHLVDSPKRKIAIQESLAVKVNLALMGKSESNIKIIYSHFAPLHHCAEWLDEKYPDVKLEAVSSTAKAVQMAAKTKGGAAIGNRMAGELYGLRILEYPLEQSLENVTQFFVVGQNETTTIAKNCRTSLVVKLRNSSGSLLDFLQPYKNHGLNLTRIISRPIPGKPETYMFLIDIKGTLSDEQVRDAIAESKKHAVTIRSLGTYPIRKRIES